MTVCDFSFAKHASDFDAHIGASIPGYHRLIEKGVNLSRRFVQEDTTVIDIGCSTGLLLRSMRDFNQSARPKVKYVGIDIEEQFSAHWEQRRAENVRFNVDDIRAYRGFENLSLATSMFTLQFLPERNKLDVLQRVYKGMIEGGALLIAEKYLASSPMLQDALTFPYYDFKRQNGFSSDEIYDKELSLRGKMTLWKLASLQKVLRKIGFSDIEIVWGDSPFVAILAVKFTSPHRRISSGIGRFEGAQDLRHAS